MNKELNRVKNNIQKKINIISIDVYKSLSDTHEKELGQLKIKKHSNSYNETQVLLCFDQN